MSLRCVQPLWECQLLILDTMLICATFLSGQDWWCQHKVRGKNGKPKASKSGANNIGFKATAEV